MDMKKQLMILLTVLLTSVTVFALNVWPGLLAGNTVHLSVTIDPVGAGSVERPERDIVIGGNATFTATANAGYGFNGWYVNGELVSTANPYQFKSIQNDLNIVAKFNSLAASTLTCSVKPGCEGMGTVSVSPEGTVSGDTHLINSGTKVAVTATAAKGHQFDRWENGSGTTLSTSATYSFTINEDCAVYAVFSKLPNYQDDLIAFPGAEGYGRFTTGGRAIDGRGANVYYVTRLDDCADNNLVEGTLRWALKSGDDTPRTILFKVSGTIYLTSRLSGVHPNVTIAGQTAPGGGICLAGYQMKLSSNSIVRHIRFRAGDLPNSSMSQIDVENVSNIILDHCTFAWSMEENLTMYDTKYTTVQWCIFSEPLYDSRNSKGNRAYGAQWGGEHSTLHHCLFASCNSRSPRFNGVRSSVNDRQVDSEFLNNVIFNWGNHNSLYGGECSAGGATDYNRVYMINNYYKPGPATKKGTTGSRYFVRPSGGSIGEAGEWYLSGNKFETGSKWAGTADFWKDDVLEKVNADNYWGYLSSEKGRAIEFWSMSPSQALYDQKLLKSLPAGYVLTMTCETADQAYDKVVSQAGASLPRYDEVDARILAEAAGLQDPQFGGAFGNKMGIIDSPDDITLNQHDDFVALYEGDKAEDNAEIDVTCYPRLQMDDYDSRVIDTDGDGLPDDYESSVGLNPNDASDAMQLTVSGYSNLEVFLNGVADRTIDMSQYTVHQPAAMANRFNAVVAQDGSGDYTNIQDAVNAAPGNSPYYIFIKAGTYEGHVQIDKANVHLTGQSRENTIISWNKTNADGGGVDKASTINVTANDVSFDNLTIRNTRINEGQALALYTKADRVSITSCNLEGWQDTYRTGKDGQRHIVRNSKVTGTTDFIYGAGEVLFDDVTLHVLRTSNVIVAPDHSSASYGYVFRNATITAAQSGSQTHLGRPWGNTPKVSYLNTRLTSGVSIPAEGWQDMGGLPIRMAEYNTMDANGNAIDLSQRKTSFTADGKTSSSKAVLSKLEADSYKLDYMLRGTDEWDADWQAFILPAPQLTVSGNTATWTDRTGYAQCYMVTLDGKATITTSNSINTGGAQYVTVQSVSAYGVLSELAASGTPTSISNLTSAAEVVGRQYYTADGRRVSRLQHGVNIIRETLANGTTRTITVVAK